MAKVSTEKITSINQDWGYNENDGLPFSGQAVQDFIKAEGIAKAMASYDVRVGATYFDSSTMIEYGFHTEEDRDAWFNGDNTIWHITTPFTFTGTVHQMKVINYMESTKLYYTTNAKEANITVGFLSQEKGLTDTTWEEVLEDALITVSIDSDGVWKPIIENVKVKNGDTYTFDVVKYLNSGENRIRVTMMGDTTGKSGSLLFSVNVTSMYLSASNFNWYTPFIEGNSYSLGGMNIGGALPKVMYIKVTGNGYENTYDVNLGSSTYINNAYYYNGLEFPNTGTGIYHVEIWIDANGLETDHLHYDIMCVAEADLNTAELIVINDIAEKAINQSSGELFKYSVYNAGSAFANPYFRLSSVINGKEVLLTEETLQNVTTGDKLSYSTALEVLSESDDLTLSVTGTFGNTIDVNLPIDNSASYPAVSGASFYMQPALRSNSQSNKENIVNAMDNTEVTATWNNASFTDGIDGWTTDDTNRRCLYLPAYTFTEINYKPLSTIGKGKTIDLTFRVDNIADYDEPILSIADNPLSSTFRGIVIYPDRIIVHTRDLNTNDLVQSYYFGENQLINTQISYSKNYKTNYGNLIAIAVNGVKKCEFAYSNTDSVVVNSNIKIGSNTADISIYNMRVYEEGFESPAMMQNFINSLPSVLEKTAAYEMIQSVIDDSYNIDYATTKGKYNTLVVEMLDNAELPHYGLSKEYSASSNLTMEYADMPECNWTLYDVYTEGQGTTSMNYWLWNLRWRLDKSIDHVEYANGYEDYSGRLRFDGDRHPTVNRITAKKNYASGMQSHKMGATGAYNALYSSMGLKNDAGALVAVYQYPVLAFQKTLVNKATNEYNYKFIGLFTIGPDKGDKATFGYDDSRFKDTVINLEGLDHNIKGAGYDYPYKELKYVAAEEAICVRNATGYEAGTEVGNCGNASTEAEIQAYLDKEYAPMFNCVYENNPLIKGTTKTLNEINANVEAWGLQKDEDGHAYQRFEFWIDGEYDILYLNKERNRYEKNGTNLLTQLGISSSQLSGLTLDQKNQLFIDKRVEAFKNNASKYLKLDDNMFYIVFMLVFGAKDNGIKNTYPYKYRPLTQGGRWGQRQDDLDSMFGADNQGLWSAKFWAEWSDFSSDTKTAYVFKGEHCVLVHLMLLAFPELEKEIAHKMFDAMQKLSNYGSNTIDKLMGFFRTYFFDKAQYYFPKSAYNKDIEETYEEAWPNYTNGSYNVDVHPLSQVVGDATEKELEWIEKRLIYLMSKYQYGPFESYADTCLGRINFRTQLSQNMTVTPAIPLYPAVASGQSMLNVSTRTMDGTAVTLNGVGGTNTNVYLMAADWLSDIGDLKALQVDSEMDASLLVASKRLKTLKVGDANAFSVTSNLAGLNIGNCPSLTKIDAQNLTTLTGEVDLSNCNRLQEALFTNTDVRNITLQTGSKIQKLALPNSLTTLSLLNLSKLTKSNLTYDTLSKVEYLRIEGCQYINPFEMLKELYNYNDTALKSVRIIGFNNEATAEDIEMLIELAEHCNGINADGEILEDSTPIIEGFLSVEDISMSDFTFLKEAYPSLTVSPKSGALMVGDEIVLSGNTAIYKVISTEPYTLSLYGVAASYEGDRKVYMSDNVKFYPDTNELVTAESESNKSITIIAVNASLTNTISINVNVTKRTYPTSITITGNPALSEINTDYSFTFTPNITDYTGTVTAEWELDNEDSDITLKSSDNTSCILVASDNEFSTSATLKCTITTGSGKTFSNTLEVYTEKVIITVESNSPVMKVMYDKGYASNTLYMTNREAAVITSFKDELFKDNVDLLSFDEFKYFVGLTEISSNCFSGCVNLTSVIIPENIEKLQGGAFENCEKLFNIGNNLHKVTLLNGSAFYNCNSLYVDLEFDNCVDVYGSVFYNCKFKNITFHNGLHTWYDSFDQLISIDVLHFSSYNSLANFVNNSIYWTERNLYNAAATIKIANEELSEHLVVPEGIVEIGESFAYLPIKSITIPTTAESVKLHFYFKETFEYIKFNRTEPFTADIFYSEDLKYPSKIIVEDLNNWINSNITIDGRISDYFNHHVWDLYVGEDLIKDLVLPENANFTGNFAFSSIASVDFQNVSELNENANFKGAILLREIKNYEHLTKIPNKFLSYCFTNHVIDLSNVKEIGKSAFEANPIHISCDLHHLEKLGECAFHGTYLNSTVINSSAYLLKLPYNAMLVAGLRHFTHFYYLAARYIIYSEDYTLISSHWFANSEIDAFIVENPVPPAVTSDDSAIYGTTGNVYVPIASLSAYQESVNWQKEPLKGYIEANELPDISTASEFDCYKVNGIYYVARIIGAIPIDGIPGVLEWVTITYDGIKEKLSYNGIVD